MSHRGWGVTIVGPTPRRDMLAGVTVGAIVVPQSLAYAELAGMPAVTGLYAALVAMLAYAVLGTCNQIALGPTATSAILATAAGSALAHDAGLYAAALATTALIAGGLAIASGLARLGFVTNLLSRPVLTGYVAGAAVTIVVSQLGALLGIRSGRRTGAERILETLTDLARSLDESSMTTIAAAAVSVAAMVVLQHLIPKAPAALIVVAGAVVAVELLDLRDHGVAVMGEVPRGLPGLAWPDLPASDAYSLLLPASALALVGFAEIVGQARAFSARDATAAEIDPNRELLALGTANAASGMFGAFPVSASFGRGAVGARFGPGTRRVGLVAAAVVALSLVALTGVFERLPQATLAAVVIVAVVPLIPVGTFRRLARLQRDDFAFAVVAAAGTLVLGVLPGLGLAVALSVLGLLYRVTAADTAVLGYVPEQDTWRRLDRHATARPVVGAVVLRFTGPLYFANASRFRHAVTEAVAEAGPDLSRVVIDGRGIGYLDVTALETLTELHRRLAGDGIDLVVAGLRGAALDTFLRSELVRSVGEDRLVYPTVRQATRLQG
jgi:SulP family sulfate permease